MAAPLADAVSAPPSLAPPPHPVSDEVRTSIRILLALRDWSQEHLATLLHTDPATLSLLLNGRLRRRSLAFRTELWRRLWITLASGHAEEPRA